MLYLKKIVTGAVLALACNIAFADVASDFKDPNISIGALIENASALTASELMSQLQAAGADAMTIEVAAAALIDSAISCSKASASGASSSCTKLTPESASEILSASYDALASAGASPESYDSLTKTVYTTVPESDDDVIAAIGETALTNPNVDPTLATAPAAAGGPTAGPLAAPPPPPPPGGSGGGGAASPS